MDEPVRNLWVTTLHRCEEVEQAMRTVTATHRHTSEQHVELGASRCNRDNSDLLKISEWFDQFDPFDTTDNRLRSLSSGFAAKDEDRINCDDMELVGERIEETLNMQTVDAVSIKTTMKVRTKELTKAIKIKHQTIYIDPTVLFLRLMLLVERSEDPPSCFNYELTPYPTSLFKDKVMRHPNNSFRDCTDWYLK